MPIDFKRDPARLAELRAMDDQLTDIDTEQEQVELLQSIRLLLGVVAHCQLDIFERMLQQDGDH